MGGSAFFGATNIHYVYDPATNTWESRAYLPWVTVRQAGTTVNGKIHIFGGGNQNPDSPISNHDVYDPTSNTWSPAAIISPARAIHDAVTLNGVLFSLGGKEVATLCQTYNSVGNNWITKNNLPDNQFLYGALVVTEGHIYRFGGGEITTPNNFAHIYNPATDSWTPLPSLPNATHALKGAAIGSKIYLTGGYYNFEERSETWIFDTQTLEYTLGIPLPIGRKYHSMVSLDSCVYVLGGHHSFDISVRQQLLRLCPYASVSSTTETVMPLPLEAMCFSGKLYFQWPEGIKGTATISMFDMAGRQVFVEKAVSTQGELYDTWVGDIPTSIYFVRLQAENMVYTCKVFAN